jgi:arsenite transporter
MKSLFLLINKNLVYAIPLAMLVGFGAGGQFDSAQLLLLKKLIMPLTILMIFPMMITMNLKHLATGVKSIKLQLTTQVINFGVVPFVAFGLGQYFFPDSSYLALGLLLAALLPTSGMTISWTGFAKGNMGEAINMTIIGLTLGSLATPLYVRYLLGAQVEMDLILVIKQIIFIVFVPMFLGQIIRMALLRKYSLPEFKQQVAPLMPSISSLGVLGIVFVAMALKAQKLSSDPALLGRIFIPLFILYLFNFLLGTLVGKFFFSRGDAIALVYGTVMRNLSIALALAINAFGTAGADAALVVAAAYIIQVQSAAWYVRLTDTLFGPPRKV